MASITIRDIAERLGVSETAVSFAINNQPGISDETRAKILKEVERTNYKPRSPRRQRGKLPLYYLCACLLREKIQYSPKYWIAFIRRQKSLVTKSTLSILQKAASFQRLTWASRMVFDPWNKPAGR